MRLSNGFLLTLAVLGLVVVMVPAAENSKPDPPTTPAAKAARKKLDASLAKADEARRLAYLAAHRQYLKELEASLRTVAASGKADEVARIAAAISEAKQELAKLDKKKQPAKAKAGRVYAAKEWQPVMEVKQGQVLQITAGGKWAVSEQAGHRSGPEGFDVEHDGFRYGTLIARVGDETFAVGTEAKIEIPADGTLEMACHDAEGGHGNNSGFVEVQIKVLTEPPPIAAADDEPEDEEPAEDD